VKLRALSRRRLVALLVVMVVAFSGVAVRLAFVQGLSWRQYTEIGESQRMRTVQLPAARGSILDRNGDALAMTVPQRTVWANPRLVTDPAGEARALALVLGRDEAALRDHLSASGSFEYIARRIDDRTADRVHALRLPGVSLIDEPKRFQPSGALAATLLGQVGVDNEGLTGLELKLDPLLRGRPGELRVERDPTGTDIPAGVRRMRPSARGDDVVLTIDRAIQYETERVLSEAIDHHEAKGGTAVVMDPRTGEVLAMANLVSDGHGAAAVPAANNLSVTSVYEPGSVNKVITIAGALQEGVVQPSDWFTVGGSMEIGGYEFSDHDDDDATKQWTVTDIVANSSNIGTIMIGQKLGKSRIDRYLRAFGLGSRTALRFPGESAGLLIDPEKWTGPSIGSVPIGQGLAVTALQMLGAYNTVANGGEYVAPKLVRSTVDTHGVAHPAPASAHHRVVSPRTARQVTAMLTEVTRVGTGTQAQVEGYLVAGKTGTAMKPEEGGRGYQKGVYVSSFAGFAPAEAPRIAAIVLLDEPRAGGYYGGDVAAPAFSKIVQYALRQLRVPPPAPAPAPTPAVPPLTNPTRELDVPPAPATTGPARAATTLAPFSPSPVTP
jgi:cell division protein FtsI (penicillin-binding protein 3)